MRNIITVIAIAAIAIICIFASGCARQAVVHTTPVEQAQVQDIKETEIVQITVFADNLSDAEEQVADAGFSVADSPRRTTAWRNGSFVVSATR